MISYIFHLVVYNPLYNALVFLIDVVPGHNVGVVVVLLTCIVMLILFPLSRSSVRTQLEMKLMEPELAKIRERNKGNKQQEAQEMMDFYKKNKINPFSTVFLTFIQIPIILGLYFIFYRGGLPIIDKSILYSFVANPLTVNMHFIGMDIAKASIVLGFLAALTQFFQGWFSVPAFTPSPKSADSSGKPSFKDDFARSMNIQIRYVIPVFIFLFSFKVSGAVCLYWATKSIFMVGQELVIRHTVRKPIENRNTTTTAVR
ncbi:MAG: YidC/Oxa1 family membrane protein insertase [Candidatus Pacebacteria bacterium]|nr:YidC/Oxa1 family membrane protein insertase [Candidatus Paceibacterota bacterium]